MLVATKMFRCFGVSVEGMRMQDVLSRVTTSQERTWVVTANPEILLEARRDPAYRSAVNHADVRVADGVGLVWVARLFGYALHRVTGVDFAEQLVQEAVTRGWRVAFIGGEHGATQKAFDAKRKQYPALQGFAHEGGVVTADGAGDAQNEEMVFQLTMASPEIVLVAFGHPKQERWIAKNIAQFPSVRAIVGIGGVFDYWAGTIKRAPGWMRMLGLEWLFRLLHQPSARFLRIIRAVFVFPILAVADRFRPLR
jgi:N-acetylglucosaminyldiphosphoundecaprenol N-acetyl-beta-D-mannosaminyltransferase